MTNKNSKFDHSNKLENIQKLIRKFLNFSFSIIYLVFAVSQKFQIHHLYSFVRIYQYSISFILNHTDIDYKLLTAQPPKVFEALAPVVLSKEMTNITNLLATLPPPIKENVNMEDISEKLSIKIFFNGVRVLKEMGKTFYDTRNWK